MFESGQEDGLTAAGGVCVNRIEIRMTQGNIGRDRNGTEERRRIDLETDTKFFENQIVPMWASTKVAASMLGISPNALRIRKCRGEIECRYFGKYLRFNVCDLQSHFRLQREE